MTEYTQEEAVFRMNEMGKAGRPFLFIIDYKRERIYVERPEEIAPSELLYDLNGLRMRITNVTCGIPLILYPENLLNGSPRMFLSRSMPIHSRPLPGISMRVILIW